MLLAAQDPAASSTEWLREVTAELAAGGAAERALPAFVGAARRVGRRPLGPGAGVARAPDGDVSLEVFCADEAARAAVLLAVAVGSPVELAAVVDTAHREGDHREKAAVVRALALLPDAGRFVDLALDAGRTNDTDLFRALACDNPYPARFYPELEFNKLVMKAAFVGAPIDRIAGLDRRASRELARMGMEYIDEQESAQRRFPPEIWLAVAAVPPPGALGRMLGYLSHSTPEHRLGAARGLERAADPRARSFLAERLEVERDPAVRAAVTSALRSLEAA